MIGQRIRQSVGSIPFVSGKAANQLPFDKFGLLYRIDHHLTGTMTFTQPAGAGAPSFTAGGPWDLLSSFVYTVNGTAYQSVMSGYAMMVASILSDREAPGYSAPLPAANGGTQQVVTDETWSLHWHQYVAVSERDHDQPVGLINLQNQEVTSYGRAIWNTESSVLTLPNGTTAAFSGDLDVRMIAQQAPSTQAEAKALAPLFSYLHTWEEIAAVTSTTGASTRIHLPTDDTYVRCAVLLRYNGSPDLTNQSGLQTISVNYGGYYPDQTTADSIQENQRVAYRGQLPNDVYLIDWSNDMPNELLNTVKLPQLNLDLGFAAAPANTSVSLLVERLVKA